LRIPTNGVWQIDAALADMLAPEGRPIRRWPDSREIRAARLGRTGFRFSGEKLARAASCKRHLRFGHFWKL